VTTTVNGVVSDVTLEISVMVYGANCEELPFFVCLADKDCRIYASGSYTSSFSGIDFSSSTIVGGTSVLRRDLGAAPSGAGLGEREDGIECGVVGHEIRFTLSWEADGLAPSSVFVDTKVGCSWCLYKLN
jgi:hypothetical protein